MFGNKLNAVEKAVKKNHVPALIELSQTRDREVNIAAITGMGNLKVDDAFHYLVTRLQDPDAGIRAAVATSLGNIANKHTKAFLASQLQKETDPEALAAIQLAMTKIKEY